MMALNSISTDFIALISVCATRFSYESNAAENPEGLSNLNEQVQGMGNTFAQVVDMFVLILGIIGLGISAYLIVSNILSKLRGGREKVSWVATFVTLALSGAFLFGRLGFVQSLSGTLIGTVGDVGSTGSIEAAFAKMSNDIGYWASIIVVIFGVIAILVSVYMLVTGLISHGRKSVMWVLVFVAFIVGSVLCVAGWNGLSNVAGAAYNTVTSVTGVLMV